MKPAKFIRIGIILIIMTVPLFGCSESTPVLPAPSLNLPSIGQTNVSITPDFSWDSVSGANRYWLMVATSESYLPIDPYATSASGCVISKSTSSTSYIPSTPLDDSTTYYWQVQASYWDGNTVTQQGEYSSHRCFMTLIDRESKIPSDQAKITPETAALLAAKELAGYYLKLGINATEAQFSHFSSPVI